MDSSTQSLTSQIVAHLVTAIEKEVFKPGDRLPPQRIMAERFGVSRTVIRDALKIMEGQNLIRIEQSSGAYINAVPAVLNKVHIEDNDKVILNTAHMDHLIKTIMCESVRLIAAHNNEEEINHLVQMVTSLHSRFSSRTSFQEKYMLESSFHIMIARYSHNPVFEKLMLECADALANGHRIACSDNKLYKKVLEINLRIVESLQERDGERANLWMNERYRFYLSLGFDPDEKGYLLNADRWISPVL